jgi:hypothetical protein
MLRPLIFVAATFLLAAAAPAAQWPQAVLKNSQERVSEQAPVSGSYIRGVGVIDGFSDKSTEPSRQDVNVLYVHVPNGTDRQLCVDIARRDGSYTATNQYELPDDLGDGFAQISIAAQTKHPQLYKKVTARDFAIVAHTGACPAQGGELVPVFWNSLPTIGSHHALTLAVQAGDRDAALYVGGKGSNVKIQCSAVVEDNVARFDRLCVIPDAATAANKVLEVEACSFGECGIIQKVTIVQ